LVPELNAFFPNDYNQVQDSFQALFDSFFCRENTLLCSQGKVDVHILSEAERLLNSLSQALGVQENLGDLGLAGITELSNKEPTNVYSNIQQSTGRLDRSGRNTEVSVDGKRRTLSKGNLPLANQKKGSLDILMLLVIDFKILQGGWRQLYLTRKKVKHSTNVNNQ
jgi:hypothetical protein